MGQEAMLKLTEVKIQEKPSLRAANAQKGITSEDFSTARVTLGDVVLEKEAELIKEALSGHIDQIVAFSEANGADGEKVRASLHQNIDDFRIDAGGGFTKVHKRYLLENGTPSGVEVLPEDFIAPEKRGGSASAAPKAGDTVGSMEL